MGDQGKRSREETIGSWSTEKLELLAKYLHAYATIMIDAFAGSGRPRARDTREYVAGSPLRALQTEPPFDGYWFIELKSWRIEQLTKLKDEFANRRIEIMRGDCNKMLRETVIPHITYASFQRGVVFLDPYGLQVEWSTVRELAEAKTFDLFVNFPLMAVTRVLKRSERPTGKVVQTLNRVVGGSDWIDRIYHLDPQMRLFEETPVIRESMPAVWLAGLYADRLREVFPLASKPVIMTNSKNSPLYALFLTSHNETAVKIMDDIFSRYLRLREIWR